MKGKKTRVMHMNQRAKIEYMRLCHADSCRAQPKVKRRLLQCNSFLPFLSLRNVNSPISISVCSPLSFLDFFRSE